MISEENQKIIDKEYINWLESYTVNKLKIYDDLVSGDNKKDSDNTRNLGMFYQIIEQYAQKNYIYPQQDELKKYYLIEYNQIIFEIGVINVQDELYYCERRELTKDLEYIGFDELINNKMNIRTQKIEDNFALLKSVINELINYDVPIEEITKTTNLTLRKIKK